MFGLSITKIIFTILVIVAVWKGFALINRLAQERQGSVKRRRAPQPDQGTRRARRQGPGAIDLRECPRCGAYFDPREGCHCGVRSNEARKVNS
ncbi:MAG: hypothetical protein AAF637_06960 [Pseudomonadota bacterium]